MTYEEFETIFEETDSDWNGDNAFQGLTIIRKYISGTVLCGADHDIIYSANVETLIESGITEEDVKNLALLNWMIQDEYLACFV